ncbi:MAG: N-acetyltransferase [Meiothermus sp.]
MNLVVTPATKENADLAAEILIEASNWAIAQGQPLWNPAMFTEGWALNGVERGELYLGWQRDEAVGTITYQHEDKAYWPDVPEGESAFFHKLAVRRSAAGTGVSKALVGWAIEKARAEGKRYLRMDTHFDRPKLRAYYENLGFQYVEEKWIEPYHLALYEMRL